MNQPAEWHAWKIIGFIIGAGLIWHGYNVIETGVLLNAEIRGGVTITTGEFSSLIGGFLMAIGLYLCAFTFRY